MNFTETRRIIAAWCRDPSQFNRKMVARHCPICDYRGFFISVGRPTQWDVRCVRCGSRGRHRLFWLWLEQQPKDFLASKRILHFAPEKVISRKFRGNPNYETADLYQTGVTHRADMTNLPFADHSYDLVMANHVIEHIDDDQKALNEIFRIVKPGGIAVISVPINGSRQETYQNPAVIAPHKRKAHFGAYDHRRYYGLDFINRLERAGFAAQMYRLPPDQEVPHGLLRDEWIYINQK